MQNDNQNNETHVEQHNITRDESSDDDEPLQNLVVNKDVNSPEYHWCKKDISQFDTAFIELELEPPVDEDCTPYQYFKKIVTGEMLQDIAGQTNIYSMQRNGTNVNLTGKELEKFIGVYFRMGLVRLPSQRSYWEIFISYDGVS